MQTTIKSLLLTPLTLFITSNALAVNVPDSTVIAPPNVQPVRDTFMLANGRVKTSVDAYFVNIYATNQRCPSSTRPEFMTSIASVDVYGAAQAIEGVNNSLTLNPITYMITGVVSAPVNVAARDNGAMVNWQIWCKPTETV